MTAVEGSAATSATTTPSRRSPARVALWVLQVLLGVFMVVASGLPKLFGEGTAVTMFDQIGAGDWLRYFVGIVEVSRAASDSSSRAWPGWPPPGCSS